MDTNYRHHAFISYAWADDQSFDTDGRPDQRGGGRGWVSTFHDRYRKHLGRQIGRRDEGERIWLDYEQLRGSDAITPEIRAALEDSALLIPILSGSWFASPWCREEFTIFTARHPDWPERVFPVRMEPVEPDEIEAEGGREIWDQLQQAPRGYQFWYRDQAQRIRTRWFPSIDPGDRDYGHTQQDMAQDMARQLRRRGQFARSNAPGRGSGSSAWFGLADQGGSSGPSIRDAPPVSSGQEPWNMGTGGLSDTPQVRDIPRTPDTDGGPGYEIPLMTQDPPARYRPSQLRRELRENLEQAGAVLLVVHQGHPDRIEEQAPEYRQTSAERPEVYCSGDQRLNLDQSGLDTRIHPITDGDMKKILEILSLSPAKKGVQGIIEGIIPSVSTKPDSTTTLRQMRDERTRQLSGRAS